MLLKQGQEGQRPGNLQAVGPFVWLVSGKYFGFDTILITLDFVICPLWFNYVLACSCFIKDNTLNEGKMQKEWNKTKFLS